MAAWQVILGLFFLLLPVVLMLDFWPHRDRLTARGRPLERPWQGGRREHPSDEGPT